MPELLKLVTDRLDALGVAYSATARTRNGITHQLGAEAARKFAFDCGIGSYHYLKDGVYRPINTDWSNETGGWVDGNAISAARIISDGQGKRRLYPRQDHTDEYIELARPQYWTGAAWANIPLPARTRMGDTLLWDATSFAIAVQLSGDQVKLTVTLKNAAAAQRIRWPVSLTGLTRDGWTLKSGTEVVCQIPQPTLVDANGTERAVEAYIRNGAVELIADVTNLAYPVVIDPTLDYQVGASGDDSSANIVEPSETTLFSATSTICSVGRVTSGSVSRRNLCVRFLGVTVPDGATYDVGYLSFKSAGNYSGTTCNGTIYGNDIATPSAPTDSASFWGLTLTTASAAWSSIPSWTADNWYNSASIVSILTELAGSYSYAAGANMQFRVDNNGSTLEAIRHARTYDSAAASAPKLHIEYTAAAATTQSIAPHFRRYASLRAN